MTRRYLVELLLTGAAIVLFIGSAFLPVARVDVQNDSNSSVTDLHLTGRCLDRTLPSLAPGESTSVWWRTCGDTDLQLTFLLSGRSRIAADLDYVHAPPPHRSRLHIASSGEVSRELRFGWFLIFFP